MVKFDTLWLVASLAHLTARDCTTQADTRRNWMFSPHPQIPAFVGGGEILRENGLMRHLISFALVWAATTPTNSQEVVSQSSWMKVQSAVGAFNIGIKIEFYCFVVRGVVRGKCGKLSRSAVFPRLGYRKMQVHFLPCANLWSASRWVKSAVCDACQRGCVFVEWVEIRLFLYYL